VQPKEDYVLKLLEDAGLITRSQIEQARSKLNGTANIVDLLVEEGVVSEADVSRSLAAQAHMDWIDLAAKIIPPEVIKQPDGDGFQEQEYPHRSVVVGVVLSANRMKHIVTEHHLPEKSSSRRRLEIQALNNRFDCISNLECERQMIGVSLGVSLRIN
jgi:hypothetical protein